jgi:histidyl-tRNA synthetase
VLRDAGMPFKINPRLVRGLDYYNLTVFEWVTDRLGAQGTVCAGGRYDGLVEPARRQANAGLWFCHGRRASDCLDQGSGGEPAAPAPDVYLVHQGEAASRLAFRVAEGLRDQGINVLLHCGGGSFKSQMKKADGSGAAFAVIIGDDEALTGEAQLKPLREAGSSATKTQSGRSGRSHHRTND